MEVASQRGRRFSTNTLHVVLAKKTLDLHQLLWIVGPIGQTVQGDGNASGCPKGQSVVPPKQGISLVLLRGILQHRCIRVWVTRFVSGVGPPWVLGKLFPHLSLR